ncbi:ABC transporter ATP-binding protein [Candidatus Peregrinibacteria bacterium]|nr:ABC transporter ATP-binding protein [Candidatus Peregrinibacteria bacterium]
MSDPILSCSGVSKTFEVPLIPFGMLQDRLLRRPLLRERRRIAAVRDASLTIHSGEWVGLYGPNGCGKSTLLRMLGGLIAPDRGHVVCNGRLSCFDVTAGFHPERSGAENVHLHGLLHGLHPSAIPALEDRIFADADLQNHRNLPLKCYSTGMQLRLGFTTAATVDADIYLFDEVLAVGDAAFRQRCQQTLRAMRQAGKTALIVSHNLPELHILCDRVLCMEGGRVLPEQQYTVAASH